MERAYKSLRELLAAKPAGVHSVGANATVLDALKLMAARNIGAVLVMDRDKLVGIITERDYARKGVLAGRLAKDTPVRDTMSKDVLTVTPTRTVQQCMAMMTERQIRHLPVVESGKILGVLSIRDLVAEVVSHHEHVIQDLKRDMLPIFNPDPSSY
jgi:CBS domain-containing protein